MRSLGRSRASPAGPPPIPRVQADRLGSVESQNNGEGVVDRPHLFRCELADATSEPLDVHGTELFDQHSRQTTSDLDLWPERCRLGAPRRGSDHHDRAGQHHVGLHHDPEPLTLLFMADALEDLEPVDVPIGVRDRPVMMGSFVALVSAARAAQSDVLCHSGNDGDEYLVFDGAIVFVFGTHGEPASAPFLALERPRAARLGGLAPCVLDAVVSGCCFDAGSRLTRSAVLSVASKPAGVAMSPDGTKAYVSGGRVKRVSVIATVSESVVSTIGVGVSPSGVAVSADGSRLYVANAGSGTVSVVYTVSATVVRTVTVGTSPQAVVLCPVGT